VGRNIRQRLWWDTSAPYVVARTVRFINGTPYPDLADARAGLPAARRFGRRAAGLSRARGARRRRADDLAAACERTWEELTRDAAQPAVGWYDEVAARTARPAAAAA
jgi:hypothetical protein